MGGVKFGVEEGLNRKRQDTAALGLGGKAMRIRIRILTSGLPARDFTGRGELVAAKKNQRHRPKKRSDPNPLNSNMTGTCP